MPVTTVIKNGDCIEIMKEMPEKSVDLIITSPPYNIGKMHSNHLYFGTYDGNDMKEADYQNGKLIFLMSVFVC